MDKNYTIYLRSGSYDESIVDTLPGGKYLTVRPVRDEVVTLQPTSGSFVVYLSGSTRTDITIKNLVIDGVNVDNCGVKITDGAARIVVAGCEIKNVVVAAETVQGVLISGGTTNAISIQNCNIHDNGDNQLCHGIYISSATGVIVEGNIIYNHSGHGVHIYLGTDTAVNTVRGNYIYGNLYGIGAFYGTVYVYNNVCRVQDHTHLRASYSVVKAYFYHNTLVGDAGMFFGVLLTSLSNPMALVDVANNIIINHNAAAIYANGVSETGVALFARNNLLNGNGADAAENDVGANVSITETGSITSAFTPATDDAADTIYPTGANPAIGGGVTDTGITTDYSGATRPSPPSVGAWEDAS